MRFFVLPSLMIGTLLLLTSCASLRTAPAKIPPAKAFQYSFKNPSRLLSTPEFAKQLSSGEHNSTVRIKLQNNEISSVTLGRSYFSANGYECRRYKVKSRFAYSACKINGRWYEASPIIITNQ